MPPRFVPPTAVRFFLALATKKVGSSKKDKKHRITGLFTLRRSSGSGFRSARSAAPPTLHSTHILPALVLLRKPLFGLAKRRKQPERYAKWGAKICCKFSRKDL
jgi:hypothetical protein